MKATEPTTLTNLALVAQLFERMDRGAGHVDPSQYRQVAGRLAYMLRALPADVSLDEVLDQLPATREMYENLHYAEAGLCRSPLEAAVDAEVRAHDLIERIRGDAFRAGAAGDAGAAA